MGFRGLKAFWLFKLIPGLLEFADLFSSRICFFCKKKTADTKNSYYCDDCYQAELLNVDSGLKISAQQNIFFAMRYREANRFLMRQFKYRYPHQVSFWAQVLEDFLLENKLLNKSEKIYLVAVPMHPTKLKQRIYNQSDLLASLLKEKLKRRSFHAQVLNDFCLRKKNTVALFSKNATERQEILKDAFAVKNIDLPDASESVLLVLDDIATTGITLRKTYEAIAEKHQFGRLILLAVTANN